jgi:hypothetical protein
MIYIIDKSKKRAIDLFGFKLSFPPPFAAGSDSMNQNENGAYQFDWNPRNEQGN